MNTIEARAILAQVSYRDWEVILGHYNSGAFWLQWIWRRDNKENRGQRWSVSNMLSKSELVKIAWQAVQAAELEDMQKHFLYRDEPIYGDADIDLMSDLQARVRMNQRASEYLQGLDLPEKEGGEEEKKDD